MNWACTAQCAKGARGGEARRCERNPGRLYWRSLPLLVSAYAWERGAPSPVGLWQGTDPGTKQPTGWFLISEHDGIYAGVIAKMFLKPSEDPKTVCDRCKDDRHNHPWLGT